jgi:hypothetical protein
MDDMALEGSLDEPSRNSQVYKQFIPYCTLIVKSTMGLRP